MQTTFSDGTTLTLIGYKYLNALDLVKSVANTFNLQFTYKIK
jgi:hypothetical protein